MSDSPAVPALPFLGEPLTLLGRMVPPASVTWEYPYMPPPFAEVPPLAIPFVALGSLGSLVSPLASLSLGLSPLRRLVSAAFAAHHVAQLLLHLHNLLILP